jgi:hypothetical protein
MQLEIEIAMNPELTKKISGKLRPKPRKTIYPVI